MARLQSGAVQFSWQLESAPDEPASATVQQMIITDQKRSRTDGVGQGRTPVLIDMNADCRAIIVNAPVAEVYRRCLEFEKLPEFISSIRKIEKTSPTSFSCLWAKKDGQLTTKVEIIMRVLERRIAWQAVSDDFRVGVVFLDSLVGGITKVTIKVRSIVEPVMLATALGLHLRNFKRFIERGTR
jgi:uncharacterized membrane protein